MIIFSTTSFGYLKFIIQPKRDYLPSLNTHKDHFLFVKRIIIQFSGAKVWSDGLNGGSWGLLQTFRLVQSLSGQIHPWQWLHFGLLTRSLIESCSGFMSVAGSSLRKGHRAKREKKVDCVIGVGVYVWEGGFMCDFPHTCTPSAHPFHLYPLLLCFNVMSLYYAAHQHAERKAVHPEQSESTRAPDSALRSNSGTLN